MVTPMKKYEAWIVGRELPNLKVVAEMRVYENSDRLMVERFIEKIDESNLMANALKVLHPGAIVTGHMRFGQSETAGERNARMLRAFLLAQDNLLPPGSDNQEAHDAIAAAILELTKL